MIQAQDEFMLFLLLLLFFYKRSVGGGAWSPRGLWTEKEILNIHFCDKGPTHMHTGKPKPRRRETT